MKMYRELNEGEKIQSEDVFAGLVKASFECGQPLLPGVSALRPIPSPTWRKISDGPVTYPCWLSDGERVEPSRLAGPCRRPEDQAWVKTATHWMPMDNKPQPPAPEKPAELIAFEKWQDRRDVDGPLLRQAWLAALEFAKGAK